MPACSPGTASISIIEINKLRGHTVSVAPAASFAQNSRRLRIFFGCETMIRHAAALTALLLLTACGDSAKLISADATAGFKTGSTNQTEVVAALGKPIHTIQE